MVCVLSISAKSTSARNPIYCSVNSFVSKLYGSIKLRFIELQDFMSDTNSLFYETYAYLLFREKVYYQKSWKLLECPQNDAT